MALRLFGSIRATRRIDLNDLARAFWLEKPVVKAHPAVQGNKEDPPGHCWENRDIQEFWIQYVKPYQNTMSSPVFRAIESLLMELEALSECPSVSEDDEETPWQYLALIGISLLHHTLNVCREAVDLLRARENDFQMYVGKVLVAALGHDMGKHPTAQVPNMPHSFKGALWLQQRIGHLKDREQIIAAVRLHHSDIGNGRGSSENPVLAVLMQADLIARRKELALVKRETKMGKARQAEGESASIEPLPPPPETAPNDIDSWFSRKDFFEGLKSGITCSGFEAFCFDSRIYFAYAIVEKALSQMRERHGLPALRTPIETRSIMSLAIPEARNEKCRLKFKNGFRPLSRWFFVFDAAMFELSDELKAAPPRDSEGRWLKSIHSI